MENNNMLLSKRKSASKRMWRTQHQSEGTHNFVIIAIGLMLGLVLMLATGRVQTHGDGHAHASKDYHHKRLQSRRELRGENNTQHHYNSMDDDGIMKNEGTGTGDSSRDTGDSRSSSAENNDGVDSDEGAGDFTATPLDKLSIGPITWRESGKVVTTYGLEVRVPDKLTRTLLEYCERTGITQRFRELTSAGGAMEVDSDGFHDFGSVEYPMTWFIQRPSGNWNSNMHWISPSDQASHEDYLRVLGEGGFDEVMARMGEYLNLEGLVCFQLTFIGVSECGDGYLHHDFTGTDGGGYNVIIPLILVPESPPELYVQSDEYDDDAEESHSFGAYQYRLGAASIIGDDATHGTARVDYMPQKQFRMAATVYMADVNPYNVKEILKDYTQHYPPRDQKLLLSQAGKHWRPPSSLPKNPQGLKIPFANATQTQ
jgi:hypothetical protein